MTFTYQPVQTKYIGLMAVLHHLLVSEYLPLANSIPEQSSTLNNNTGARRALDGVNRTEFVHNNGCSHTAEVVEEVSWWRVMLDKPAILKSVAVFQGNNDISELLFIWTYSINYVSNLICFDFDQNYVL